MPKPTGPMPMTRSDSFLTPSTLDQIFSISLIDRLACRLPPQSLNAAQPTAFTEKGNKGCRC